MLTQKRLQVTPAADLAICIQEAKHIAAGLGQTMHTGHLLLSFFTVPGPAEILLEERTSMRIRSLPSCKGICPKRLG